MRDDTLEIQEHDVEIFDISEDGNLFLEKSEGKLILCEFDSFIDIHGDYKLQGNIISQGETQIDFVEENYLKYFNILIQENINED